MNTKNKLPTKLHRALSSIKQYLDRMPQGVSLDMAVKKVGILSTLTSKELALLVDHLGERESVHVYRLNPLKGGTGRLEIRYLKMKRFGEPFAPQGFQLWPPFTSDEPVSMHQSVDEPVSVSSAPERQLNPEPMTDNSRFESARTFSEPTKEEAKSVAKTPAQVAPVIKSAAQMRKEAEELLRQAEEAERISEQSDFFKKRLSPIKLELLQAANAIRTNLDGLIDGMAALEKAGDKLKELTA